LQDSCRFGLDAGEGQDIVVHEPVDRLGEFPLGLLLQPGFRFLGSSGVGLPLVFLGSAALALARRKVGFDRPRPALLFRRRD
jgi:hypothetical protein